MGEGEEQEGAGERAPAAWERSVEGTPLQGGPEQKGRWSRDPQLQCSLSL